MSMIFGNHFLEASAGTGKTYAIQNLFVELILSQVPFDQILVITFTKAAARELKTRIHRQILETLKKFEKNDEEKASFLERALGNFDNAKIFTIHGFCYKALREGGQLYQTFSDPDQVSYDAILFKEVIHCLRKKPYRDILSPSQWALLLKNYDNSITALAQKVVEILKENAEIPSFPDFSTRIHTLNENIKNIEDGNNFFDQYMKIFPSFKHLSHAYYTQQAETISLWIKRKNVTAEEVDIFLEKDDFFFDYLTEDNQKKRAGEVDLKPLSRFKEKIFSPLKEATQTNRLLFQISKACQNHIREIKAEKSILMPDDLLLKMQLSAKDSCFVKQMREKYRAVIIDEFQDTDRLQWEILRELFLGHALAFYLVGDPKQSIYSFRNADLNTYLKALEEIGEENKKDLTVNYRSSPSLLGALNAFFSSIYPPAKAAKASSTAINDGKGSMHFFYVQGEKSKKITWPPKEIEEEFFFPFIAQEIIALKKNHTISFDRMAILVKDRFQAERLQLYLTTKKVPSFAKGSTLLTETFAFSFFETLFEAISHSRNLNLIKQVLGSKFLGFPLDVLRGREDNPLLKKALFYFSSFEELLKREGFSKWWNRFLKMSFADDETVLDRFESLNPEDYNDILQIVALILQREASSPARVEDYLSYLDQLKIRALEGDEALKRKSFFDEERVLIMTTHMSKGLEFDIVFALGMASRHGVKEDFVKSGDVLLLFDEKDEKCKAALQLKEKEKFRLLYVALTRAKQRVYIPYYFDEQGTSLSPLELYFQSILEEGYYCEKTVNAYFQKLAQKADVSFTQLKRENLIVPEWRSEKKEVYSEKSLPSPSFPKIYMHSFSSLAKKHEGVFFHLGEGELPSGPETGRMIHGIFEQIFKEALYFPWDEDKIRKKVKRYIGRTAFETWDKTIEKMVLDAFQIPLFDTFCLRDVHPSYVLTESEFEFFFHKRALVKGFADLIFKQGGRYYLLDWKTNRLEGYTKDHLESAMRANDYYFQGAIYAHAMRKFLGEIELQPFEEIFGGMFYVFLRGFQSETKGIYAFIPEENELYARIC